MTDKRNMDVNPYYIEILSNDGRNLWREWEEKNKGKKKKMTP